MINIKLSLNQFNSINVLSYLTIFIIVIYIIFPMLQISVGCYM
jgi:hypothetical protein